MSKFLKFIVNLFLVMAIVVTAGIIIPPLLGVNTTIVDTAGMDTNLPLGSVTYSREKAVLDLAAGDEILKESGTSTYAYIVQEGDAATGEFTVVSATEPEASPEVIVIRNNVSEVVLTVPYIGFVVVAMQSLEGRIIIALVILFIIILFILSELWKKRDDDEDDDEYSGDGGNVQAASADAAVDAGDVLRDSKSDGAGYSKNIKDNRGYGTVSQDTAEITAAMAELRVMDARPSAKKDEAVELSDSVEPVEAESLGDTKVFPGSLSSQMGADIAPEAASVAAEPLSEITEVAAETPDAAVGNEEAEVGTPKMTAEAADTAVDAIEMEEAGPKNTMEEALIAETEKAAAAWGDAAADVSDGDEEEEPKLLWSWTDEPFENEIDGDGWNGIQTGQRVDADDIPERFAPVERMTRQEILEQARSGGSDPKVLRDDVTGIDIIDYSDLL